MWSGRGGMEFLIFMLELVFPFGIVLIIIHIILARLAKLDQVACPYGTQFFGGGIAGVRTWLHNCNPVKERVGGALFPKSRQQFGNAVELFGFFRNLCFS